MFPQLRGLGRSATARLYGVDSLEEARAYVQDEILGARLRECCAALLANAGLSAERILGEVDAMKLRSSMTLFALADPDEPIFREVLDRFYGGEPDSATERLISSRPTTGRQPPRAAKRGGRRSMKLADSLGEVGSLEGLAHQPVRLRQGLGQLAGQVRVDLALHRRHARRRGVGRQVARVRRGLVE